MKSISTFHGILAESSLIHNLEVWTKVRGSDLLARNQAKAPSIEFHGCGKRVKPARDVKKVPCFSS